MPTSTQLWCASLVLCLAGGLPSHAQPPDLASTMASWQHHPRGPELPVDALTLDVDRRRCRRIDRADATGDVDRLFYLLEHGYCGYGYFARDHGFEAAHAAIVAELATRSTWSTADLVELVREHLDFITDAHLKLGDETFASHDDFWFAPDAAVMARGGRLWLMHDKQAEAMVTVDGRPPAEFAHRSLAADGRAHQILGVLSAQAPPPLQITVETPGGQAVRQVPLKRSAPRQRELFRRFQLGGLPVVRIGTFSDHDVAPLEAFMATADELRDAPCIIVDLRGNGGGNTRWARRWISRLTGRAPQLGQVLSELVTRTALVGQANYMAWLAAGPGDTIVELLDERRARLAERIARFDAAGAEPRWQAPAIPTRPPIANDVTLVVVTDARVASAGEGFLSFLRGQVENVVVVGENTRGALTFGHLTVHRLPASGLLVFLPVKLNLPLDGIMREGRGFEPDYWVPADQALNHAVAAVRAGTIATVRPLPPAVLATDFEPETPPRFTPRQKRRWRRALAVVMAVIAIAWNVWAWRRVRRQRPA